MNKPACNCLGCQTVELGRQIHGNIAELRKMVEARDARLNEVYNIAANNTVVNPPKGESPCDLRGHGKCYFMGDELVHMPEGY